MVPLGLQLDHLPLEYLKALRVLLEQQRAAIQLQLAQQPSLEQVVSTADGAAGPSTDLVQPRSFLQKSQALLSKLHLTKSTSSLSRRNNSNRW